MKTQEVKLNQPEFIDKVPLVPFKVIAAGIPFYSDEKCENEVRDARLIIIQALDPEDDILELEIMPTTQAYQVGQYVTLALEHKRIWGECWFKDPESGEVSRAWKVHVDFIGDVVSPAAIEKDSERLAELEKRMKEKLDRISKTPDRKVN